MTTMKEILKSIGLTEEEINTYLLLLREKDARATKISKKLGVARSSSYNWLNNLVLKGLATESMINGSKAYNATKPSLIPTILDERVDSIKKIVPELEAYSRIKEGEDTAVSLFKGNEGVKMVMNDILLICKPYTCFGEIEKYFLDLDIFTQNWIVRAESMKINGRLISSKKQKFLVGKNEECRFLSKNNIPEISTVTYGDKTALFIWTKIPSVILIEDPLVTKRELELFERSWKQAKS